MGNLILQAKPQAIAGEPVNVESMLAWCEKQNDWCAANKLDRWYYVAPSKDGKKPRIEQKQGLVAEEVHGVMRGWRPAYQGWSREKLDKEFGLLKFLLRQGVTEQTYRTLRVAA